MSSNIEQSYDLVAEKYTGEFFDELSRKPFDGEVLDRFAATVPNGGTVCDIGCGPGHVARHLAGRGVRMRGIDLSAEMVRHARRLNPGAVFEQGDMLSPRLPDGSVDGVICFYAIIHLQRQDVPRALAQMHRVLRAGGRVLLAYHGGEGTLHRDVWYELPISIDVTLFEGDEIEQMLRSAGFDVEKTAERPPYPFEYPTRRLYTFARKPEGSAEEVSSKRTTTQ